MEIFKTTPYKHQLDIYKQSKDMPYAALFLEQRCGKTKIILDTAAYQYHAGHINGLLIIAPNGVARNWLDEVQIHLTETVNHKIVLWRSGKMATKAAMVDLTGLLRHGGLSILSMNIDALITTAAKTYLTKWFQARRTFVALDESIDISSPGAARTKVALRVARRSIIRRIADGTPADAKPLGLYAQTQFLEPGLLGASTYVAFKARYTEQETRDVGEHNRICDNCGGNGWFDGGVRCERCRGSCFIGNKQIETVVGYKNLDELAQKLKPFAFRVTRADCADLPPKVFERRYFALSPVQQRIFNELKMEFRAELAGKVVTANIVLTRLLRLQQVASNHLPIDGDLRICEGCQGEGCANCDDRGVLGQSRRVAVVDPDKNPRLETLQTVLEPLTGQGIIWTRFVPDVEAVMGSLRNAVRYDGQVPPDQRIEAIQNFQAGNAQYFVANPRAAGRGLDLSAANFVVYYAHDWSLRWRNQSEDRAQSLKRTESVLYIDLVAEATPDEKIIAALRDGKELSEQVLGDLKRVFD
jgi:SNF2 family DNA or RNA helicase